MVELDSFRERLGKYLRHLTPDRVVGASGLAVLCAASALALVPVPGQPFAVALGAWLGGLGLNVLAGVLQQSYQILLSQPTEDELDQVTQLARALACDIRDQPDLLREIEVLLDNLNAFQIAVEVVEGNPAVHGWLLMKIHQDVVQYRTDFERIHETLHRIEALVEQLQPRLYSVRPFTAPPIPSLIIGREDALGELKSRLGITVEGHTPASMQRLSIVRGWPGVGKTTLAVALAYDPDIAVAFPDGVLWASLGEKPNLFSELVAWGRALGVDDIARARTLEDAVTQLRALLHNKRILLIVDDVWETEHAVAFQVGGPECAMMLTTRLNDVAQALATMPEEIYVLAVLTDKKALDLLKTLAPTVVEQHPQESLELVRDLEGLPLALLVAGRLLNAEAGLGWGVTDLLAELREGTRLLESDAPADRIDIANQTTPTVAVLLQKSTDRLDPETRDRFTFLGAFAPKPATFDLDAMTAVWQVSDPKPTARVLVDRGLLEPVGEARFQMHALLAMHARSLLTE